MSTQPPPVTAQDDLFASVFDALVRARTRAEDVARATGTCLIEAVDGKPVRVPPPPGSPRGEGLAGRYLEVTFRNGQPLAAYLHLPRGPRAKVVRTIDAGQGLRVDYDALDVPVGVEITAPQSVTVADMNALLTRLMLDPLPAAEWEPLRAA